MVDGSSELSVQGCAGLVSQTAQSCMAQGLTSDTPYQFKVRVVCALEERTFCSLTPKGYSDLC